MSSPDGRAPTPNPFSDASYPYHGGMHRSTAAAFLLCLSICACRGAGGGRGEGPTASSSRMRLQHVVLVDLADDADIAAMRADSDRMLPGIPSVRRYVCGTPFETGRPNVAKDYDLGIVVEFDSPDDYKAYLEHPVHVELVRTWKPRWRRSYIVDFAP